MSAEHQNAVRVAREDYDANLEQAPQPLPPERRYAGAAR